MSLPMKTPPSAVPFFRRLFGAVAGPQRGPTPVATSFSLIAQENSGKTVLLKALLKEMAEDLPSGLGFEAGDPLAVRQMIRETEITLHGLRKAGQPTTVKVTDLHFHLFRGTQKCIAVTTHEVIGQVLTHTFPDSPADQLQLYEDYQQRLKQTPALLVGVPMPAARPTALELERWQDRMRTSRAYLRLALEDRSPQDRVAVALLLFKADAGFPSLDEAQAAATDDLLRAALRPLVNTLRDSDCVHEAVIAPVSSYGFGNARPADPKSEQERKETQAGARDIEWLLADNATMQPFNVLPVLVWTTLAQLQTHPVDAQRDTVLIEVCERLRQDLEDLPRWLVPVKGNLV